MVVPSDIARTLNDIFNRNEVRRSRRNTICIPRRSAVHANFAGTHGALEETKSYSKTLVKLVALDFGKLGFRIVDVKDLDRIYSQVTQTLIDLVFQVSRRHAMTASDDIGGAYDSGVDEVLHEVFARIPWHLSIKTDEACLGGDDNLVPGGSS